MTSLAKRACGPCRVCCVELKIDVPELRKKARVSCQHLTQSGCGIYASRPPVCQQFLCGWRLFEELGDDWRPDLSGVMLLRMAPSELPVRLRTAPYGVHMAVIGGVSAVTQPAFARYVTQLLSRDIPILLSAASPYIVLNEHLEKDAAPAFLKSRLAELYALLHAARFGASLWKRIAFLYQLQIDRQRQKLINKSST